ncbi:MAG: 3-dehydroquinate synthase [Oscillospiraceae bacterium]|jgi:3-dehydroquinate synthase|nr:3-dehydroquinate synthase [Oscillospiraceae bacterium]
MITLTVSAPSREYAIDIGPGALEMLSSTVGAGAAALVTDSNVSPLYAERALGLLRTAGARAELFLLPAGEQHKTPDAVALLCRDFALMGLRRRDYVIALGGGVVGDTAGFAASCYMRGVRLIQVPTSLIAMTDSSVGGKTGVNLPEGKNLMGAFYQPERVLIDTDFLKTLPVREVRAGLAEVVKYFALGEREIPALLPGGELSDPARLIYLCCRLKAGLVARDERDTGARMALNFGHTFAHAIEKHGDYAQFNHGEAVAIGMRLALETGERLGVTPPGVRREIMSVISKAGLDTELDFPATELIPHMSGDKKRDGDGVTLVLLRDIGDVVLRETTHEELEAALC